MKRHTLLLLGLLLLLSSGATAQNAGARKETRKGNREYKAKRYERAEVNYRRALQEDSSAYRAHYNLGNALYRQRNYNGAAQHFDSVLMQPDLSDKVRSQAFHNKGNSNLQAGLQQANRADGMQQFQQAVNDYQEALKLNPKNEDTRYNLSYAKKMLQQAQQQQQQQQQNQQNKNDQNNQQNQQQQNQQQDQKQDQQQNQNNQNDQNNPQDQQQQQDDRQKQQEQRQQNKQQQKQQQQKKQDAERMLEAVKNNEKNTMKEHAKKMEVSSHGRIEKDW